MRIVPGDTLPTASCPDGFLIVLGETLPPTLGADGLRNVPGDTLLAACCSDALRIALGEKGFLPASPGGLAEAEGLRTFPVFGADGLREEGTPAPLAAPLAPKLGEVACLPACFSGTGLMKSPGGTAPVGRRCLVTTRPAA